MANISQVQLPDNSIYDIVPVINPNNTVIDASVHVGPYPLNANSLCMVATDGKLYPFVQTLGTGTGTTYNIIPDTIKFRIGTDVFAAGKAYDGSAGAIDVSTLAISEEVDIRYSSRRLTGASGTSYSAIPAGQHNEIYMYISIQPKEGTFNPTCYYMDGYGGSNDYIVNILAKEKVKANKFCMFLGYSSSYSTYYKVWLSPEHPIYYCDSERNFIPYDTWRNYIQDTSINIIDGSITNIENTINNLPAPDASLYINKIVDGSIKIDAYPLNENSLCAFTTDNLLCAFVQDATTGTASIVPNTKKFRLGCDILIAGSDYTAGQSAGNVYTLKASDKVDLRYSETTHTHGTNSTNNTHREMFMPIDISTLSGTFTLKTVTKSSKPYNFIQKASLVSNNFYMYMGYIAENAVSYSFWLDTNHPVYWYNGTNLIPYDTWRNNIQDTSISLIDTSIANIESAISSSSGSIYFAKTTSNSSNTAMLVSIPEVTAYYEGLKIALYYTVSTPSTVSATLKVNDLAAKRIYAKDTASLSQGLAVNSINYLCYVGTASDGYFILDRDINTDTDTLAYRNPVAGYNRDSGEVTPFAERRFKATDIIKAQLVFEGEDSSIYSITQSDVSVNPDWGLAYWGAGGTGSMSLTVNNVIQQESLVIADTCIGIGKNIIKPSQYFPVYAWFKYTNNTIKSTVDSSVLHPTVPLAIDLSNDTYVYVGTVECVDNQAKYLHMDLSNHDFITLGNKSTSGRDRNIIAINGKLLDGGGTSGGNYNNPVSGAGVNPPAAYALQQYDFVCYDISQNGLVPLHCYYDGTLSTSGISYDWGLAFCNAAVAATENPPEGSILQQITLDTANTAGKPTHMYMFFDSDGMLIPNQNAGSFPIFSGQASDPPEVSELTPYVPSGKELTQIYIGTWAGDKFHIDLSNHDFITYGTQISQGSNPGVYGHLHTSGPYISYINGRPFLGASGGGSGAKVAYGICDDYDMGGVTPRSGSGDGIDRGQISGSGPFTLIATTNDGNYTPGESLVSLYLTGIDMYAGAYLQIDNNTAYPIYYEDHAVTRSELESESVATFIFNSSTYYLVAGAAGGDYELTANRVQCVDSSSAYNQYPSARCIYNIVGDIEAALQAI